MYLFIAFSLFIGLTFAGRLKILKMSFVSTFYFLLYTAANFRFFFCLSSWVSVAPPEKNFGSGKNDVTYNDVILPLA